MPDETSSTFLPLLHHRALSPPGDKRQNKVWDPASLGSAGSGWCPISGSLHHTKKSHSYTISIQTIIIQTISKPSNLVSNNLRASTAAPAFPLVNQWSKNTHRQGEADKICKDARIQASKKTQRLKLEAERYKLRACWHPDTRSSSERDTRGQKALSGKTSTWKFINVW